LNGLDDTASSTGNDLIMAKLMADALDRHYSQHLWAVTFDSKTGIATVRDLLLSGEWGYVLKIPAIYSASSFQADVIAAGGEILERFRLARGRFDEAQYVALPTNFAGDFVFDK
jgi:hypothetical protein